MMKNDIKEWKNFKINEIFETQTMGSREQVPTGASVSKKCLVEGGNIARITVTSINNGISGYYECIVKNNPNFRVYKNFISVSFLGTIFYHKDECSLDMKVHCLKPKSIDLNKYTGTFLVSALKASLQDSSYADQISSTILPNLDIQLPIDADGCPDWNYMEQYMKKIEIKSKTSLKMLNINKTHNPKIDIEKWRDFHLYDLFYIDSGTKMDKIAMKYNNPTINFVGRSGVNNGVTAIVDRVENYKPYKAGNLTLALGGAYLGSCFVQKEDFYTSQNVIVLIPKENISFAAKQFICSVIFKEGNSHYKAFIDELNRHIKKDFSIKLPVDNNGNPDYKFMDQYMNSLMKNTIDKIEYLKNL